MSLPPSTPLPQGWTEHIGPNAQTYYYNEVTRESTYNRPLPSTAHLTSNQPEKKERPLFKAPIPGTDWLRVRTTEGNVFYSHKMRKESVWMVPEEIKSEVERFEQEERLKQQVNEEPSSKRAHSEEMEIERIRNEVQALVKRKAEVIIPVDEVVTRKKARTDYQGSDEESEADISEVEEDQPTEGVEELAAGAEGQKEVQAEKKGVEKGANEEERFNPKHQTVLIPDQVNLSTEEAKALFKTLLREKNVNPLHPWDKSLPLFVSDPRYVLLPSVIARREAFDEYCRERARELKETSIKKEKRTLDPREDFETLLLDEVKSTRTSWSDFRRTWKKDRRFYGWGRDDREREKRFREFIKELGEKKRTAAEKAEVDFIALLRERIEAKEDLLWKDVKQGLYDDPRYDAVGSSSLREELFKTFVKGKVKLMQETTETENNNPKDEEDEKDEKGKRKEQALREREGKVRAERVRLDAQIERSKQGLGKEEGERLFRSLLTDAIRDPQTWEGALPQLKTDPRFINSSLPLNHRVQLFHVHITHLRAKHINNLYALFQSHTGSLATSFTDLPVSTLLSSLPVTKLGYNIGDLQHEYSKWQRERFQECRKAFDEMLSENSFVEFWGRLGKMGGEGVDGFVKADDLGEDEGEGGGGRVDMKVLAKNIDINEIVKVIKNERRYTAFDHIPEKREQWIRDYLANLSAPKLSVHIPERIAS